MSGGLWLGGCGAINGLGLNAHQSWAFRRADVRAVRPSPFLHLDGTPIPMGMIPGWGEEQGAERTAGLLEAFANAALPRLRSVLAPERIGLGIVLPRRYAGLTNLFTRRFDSWLPRDSVECTAGGAAGFVVALERGRTQLDAGRFDAVALLGVDTAYCADVIDDLLASNRVFHPEAGEGLIPAEGVGFCVVASAAVGRQLGWAGGALLEGAALVRAAPDGSLGSEISRAVAAAVGVGGSVDLMLGDATPEPERIRRLQAALVRIADIAATPSTRLEMLPDHFGDLGAATLPTGIAVAAQMFAREPAPPRRVLLWAGDDDEAGAIVIRDPRARA